MPLVENISAIAAVGVDIAEVGVGSVARGAKERVTSASSKPGGNAGPVFPAMAAVGVDMVVDTGVTERGVGTVDRNGANARGPEDSGCQGCVDKAGATRPGGNAGPIMSWTIPGSGSGAGSFVAWMGGMPGKME